MANVAFEFSRFDNGRRTTRRLPRLTIASVTLLVWLWSCAAYGATITVTGTGDTIAVDGVVTLREAITSANNNASVNTDVSNQNPGAYGADFINFNIGGGTGVKTINLTAPLPTITDPIIINGYSQPGSSANTLANSDNAVLLIQLNGTGAGSGADGLTLGSGSTNSIVKGLVINRFAGNGIVIKSSTNTISGNFIGVDPTGTIRMPNGTYPNTGDGIRILNVSNNNIGSTAAADRNVISGNALAGIHVIGTLAAPATGNLIRGNFIGIAADGKSSLTRSPAQPTGITRGADGSLWFTEFANNAIGRITTAGVITEFSLAGLQPNSGPAGIVSDPTNNLLYFTEENVGRIGRINPLAGSDAAILASELQSAVVPSGSGANVAGITVGPDGNLWFTEENAGRVCNINTTLTTINEFTSITAGATPVNIVSGADGNLWFTEFNNNAVGRITTAGAVTEFSLSALGAGTGPRDIVSDPANSFLYFTLGNSGRIGKINPLAANILASETQSAVVPSGTGAGLTDLTVGPDSNIWFAEANVDRIGTINPTLTTITEFIAGITAGASPHDIVTGPDAALWFTESGRNAVGRITTAGSITEFGLPPAPFNNLYGIEISGGNLNTAGGATAGSRNVVGLNEDGIEIDNGGQQNIIQGNFVGVGADGTTAIGNTLHGVALRSSSGFGAPLGPAQPNEPGVSFNTIGGTTAGTGNLVEFNGTSGIAIFGNPVSASGQANVSNAIEGNSIFENGRSNASPPSVGIDLSNSFPYPKDDGATPNDSKGHGAANDPNNFQDFPVLSTALSSGGTTSIVGVVHGAGNSTYRIEFFANDTDPLGLPPEGQQFLGSANITTDSNGSMPFSSSLNVAVASGRIVTATATDAGGNTSEFSNGVTVNPPPSPTPTATATATATATPTPTATATATPPAPAQTLNISTRMQVQGGNNVLIAGFIVNGAAQKTVAILGIGPSLSQFFSGVLADPTLELHTGNTTLATNDNWQDDSTQATLLSNAGLAPSDPRESGIVVTLPANASYTAILAGKNGGTGIGNVQIYDISQSANSQLANISSRGFVQTGNNVMIGGFILGGNGTATRVAVRGIGPSLAQFGLSPLLADPTLELHDSNGVTIATDDNWQDDSTQAAQLTANGLAPSDPNEAAIFTSLPPGQWTAILAGKNGGTGIGVVEIFNLH